MHCSRFYDGAGSGPSAMRFDFTKSGRSVACPLGNANLQQQFPQPICGVWRGTSAP